MEPSSTVRSGRRTAALFVFTAAAALAGGYAVSRWLRPGVPARKPALTELTGSLPDPDGVTLRLDTWTGKVVLLNFWATWCAPCREEMPLLMAAQDEFGPRGLQVIGIALDDAEPVRLFRDELDIRYPLLLAGREGSELMARLGNDSGALPFTVLFDRAGQARETRLGMLRPDDLGPLLLAHLASVE